MIQNQLGRPLIIYWITRFPFLTVRHLAYLCCGRFVFSQAVNEGSPTHPSYPSGHAVQNGAFATVLKVNCRHHAHRKRFGLRTQS